MNVEITDNSKEVSGAIHQVGQAMADTGSLLQTWESLQQGHWHRTVVIRYSRKSLRALRAFCKWESLVQQGRRNAARFAASPQVALASPSGELVLLSRTIQNGYFLLHGHSGTGTIGAAYQQGGVCHE